MVGSSVVDAVGDDIVSGGSEVSVAVLHVVLSVVSGPAVDSDVASVLGNVVKSPVTVVSSVTLISLVDDVWILLMVVDFGMLGKTSGTTATSGDAGTLSVEVVASEALAFEVDCVVTLVSGLEGAVASLGVMSTAVVPVPSVVDSETVAGVDSRLKLVDTTVLFIPVVSAITVEGNV